MPRGGYGEMNIIRSEIRRKRGHMSIRKLTKTTGGTLQRIKPVFLMSPISVAQFLPPNSVEFDLLVIDEASQVRPEDALGLVVRAKQMVVVGDNKQLPPTSFFDRVIADEEDADLEEETSDLLGPAAKATELESILALCEARGIKSAMLRWHYRSRHHSLIEVSNAEFYGRRLIMPPAPVAERASEGLILRRVAGAYDRGGKRNNLIEAEAVANSVAAHARTSPNVSLGIVTFSSAQRDAIEDLLEVKRRSDDTLDSLLQEGKGEDVFVKKLRMCKGTNAMSSSSRSAMDRGSRVRVSTAWRLAQFRAREASDASTCCLRGRAVAARSLHRSRQQTSISIEREAKDLGSSSDFCNMLSLEPLKSNSRHPRTPTPRLKRRSRISCKDLGTRSTNRLGRQGSKLILRFAILISRAATCSPSNAMERLITAAFGRESETDCVRKSLKTWVGGFIAFGPLIGSIGAARRARSLTRHWRQRSWRQRRLRERSRPRMTSVHRRSLRRLFRLLHLSQVNCGCRHTDLRRAYRSLTTSSLTRSLSQRWPGLRARSSAWKDLSMRRRSRVG